MSKEERYQLYGDWWTPQTRIDTEDRLVEVYNQSEKPDEEAPCTSVRIYHKDEKLDVLYTAKGCIEICMFMNDSTPDSYAEDDVRNLHVCSMPNFIAALKEGEHIAAEHWYPI